MTSSYEVINPKFANFVETDKEPALIADGYTWTEGPVWYEHALYFNDIPGKQMLRWSAIDGAVVVLEYSEFANGNTPHLDGAMVSCEHGGRRVIKRRAVNDLNAKVYHVATNRRDAAHSG